MKFAKTPFGRIEVSKTIDKTSYKISAAARAKLEETFGAVEIVHGEDHKAEYLVVLVAGKTVARYRIKRITDLTPGLCDFCRNSAAAFPRREVAGPCTCQDPCPHRDTKA